MSNLDAIATRSAPATVPAAKTSLVGLTRAGLAEALAAIDVPERERKMRVAQLWQ